MPYVCKELAIPTYMPTNEENTVGKGIWVPIGKRQAASATLCTRSWDWQMPVGSSRGHTHSEPLGP